MNHSIQSFAVWSVTSQRVYARLVPARQPRSSRVAPRGSPFGCFASASTSADFNVPPARPRDRHSTPLSDSLRVVVTPLQRAGASIESFSHRLGRL